jgi:DNA-directed RNA polymerase specialized sigma24 family protein
MRFGENHPMAKLIDREVEIIRVLHEDHGMSYRKLASIYQLPLSTISSICQYRTRRITSWTGWE